MKSNAFFLAAFLAFPTMAADSSTYDLLIVACRQGACERIGQESVASGVTATFHHGLRLTIATLTTRTGEDAARVSLNIGFPGEAFSAAGAAKPLPLAQRLEAMVVQSTLRPGSFSSLASFVNSGTTYQIWGRPVALR